MRRVAIWVVAAAIVGSSLGVAWTLTARHVSTDSQASYPDLPVALERSDVLLYVRGIAPLPNTSNTDPDVGLYALTVDRGSHAPDSYPTTSGKPARAIGSQVVVETYRPGDGTDGFTGTLPDHAYLVGLSYIDPDINTGAAATWGLSWIFDPEAGAFVGPPEFESLYGPQLDVVDLHHKPETLFAWRKEIEVAKETNVHGVIMAQWARATHGPTKDDAWYAADPRVRGLDPELTPQAVLAKLLQRPVYFDVPATDADWISGVPMTIVVRSKDGVGDSFAIDVGPHSAQILFTPHSRVEVYLVRANAPEGVLLGSFTSVEWTSGEASLLSMTASQLEDAVLALNDGSTGSTSGNPQSPFIVLTSMTQAELAALDT